MAELDFNTMQRLFDGPDTWEKSLPPETVGAVNSQLATSIDPRTDRMVMANQALLAQSMGLNLDQVAENYPALRDEYASQVFHVEQPLDDAGFYTQAGTFLKKRADERAMVDQMGRGLFESFRKGRDFTASFGQSIFDHADTAGWDQTNIDLYEETMRSAWTMFEEKRAQFEPAVEAVQAYFTAARAGAAPGKEEEFRATSAAAMEALQGVSDEDADMVIALAAGAMGEAPAAAGGFAERAARRVERGVSRVVGGAADAFARVFEGPYPTQFGFETMDARRDRLGRKLQQAVAGEVDPLSGSSWAEEVILKAADSLPYTLIAATGPGLVVAAGAAQTEIADNLTANGVAPTTAQPLAAAVAPAYAAVEFLQSRLLFGGRAGSLKALADRQVLRFATEFGVELGEQAAQETVQQFIPAAAQSLGALVSEAIPERDWRKEFEQYGTDLPELLGVLSIYSLVGAGAATFRDRAYGKALLEREDWMQAAGFPPAVAARAAAATTPEEASAVLAGAMEQREFGPAQQAAVAEMQAEFTAPPEAPRLAPAVFKGIQPGLPAEMAGPFRARLESQGMSKEDAAARVEKMMQGLELYDLTADLPGHPAGSTVTRETLEAAGFVAPPKPALELDFREERTANELTLFARVGGRVAGRGVFAIEEGKATPRMIDVQPEFRRQGVATAIYEQFTARNPGVELGLGTIQTPEGAAFRTAYEARRAEQARLAGPRAEVTRNALGNYVVSLGGVVVGVANTPEMAAKLAGEARAGAGREMAVKATETAPAEALPDDVKAAVQFAFAGVSVHRAAHLDRLLRENLPRTARRVATLFSRPGELQGFRGSEPGRRAMGYANAVLTDAGLFWGQNMSAFEQTVQALSGSEKKWARENFRAQYEAKGAAGMPSKKLRAFAEAWTEIHNRLGQLAEDYQVEIRDDRAPGGRRPFKRSIPNYYPRAFTKPVREAIREGKGLIYDALVAAAVQRGVDIRGLTEENSTVNHVRRFGHLENPRIGELPATVTTRTGEVVKVLEQDPFVDLERYIDRASVRLAIIKNFSEIDEEGNFLSGQENAQRVAEELSVAIKEAGHPVEGRIWDGLWANLNGQIGADDQRKLEESGLSTVLHSAENIARLAQLSLSTISQVTMGWVPIAARGGMLNLLRQATALGASKLGASAKTQAELDFTRRLGAWSHYVLGHTYETEDFTGVSQTVARRGLTVLGFQASNRVLNQIGSLAAIHNFADAIAALREPTPSGWAAQAWGMDRASIRRMLERNYALTPQQIDRMVLGGIDYNDFATVERRARNEPDFQQAYRDLAQAAQRFTGRTNLFREPLTDRPPWMSRRVARMFMAYMSMVRAMGNIMSDALREVRHGNVKPFVTLFVGGALAGAASTTLRNLLYRREDEPDESKFAFLKQLVEWQNEAGIYGLLGSEIESAYWDIKIQGVPTLDVPLLEWWFQNVVGVSRAASEQDADEFRKSLARTTPLLRAIDAQTGGPLSESRKPKKKRKKASE